MNLFNKNNVEKKMRNFKSIIGIIVICIFLVSCSSSSDEFVSSSNPNDDIVLVDIKSNSDFIGDWIQINSENGRFHMASIDDDTMTIYVYFEEDESTELYWTGTFDTNIDIKDSVQIESKNHKYITDYFTNTSHVESKNFLFEDGCINYEATFLGAKENVVLARCDSKDLETIKLTGNRTTKFDHEKNAKIEFANTEFEIPSYFDSKEETSTDDFIEYFPSDNSAYASFTAAHLILEEKITNNEILDYAMYGVETADEAHSIIDTEEINVDGVHGVVVRYSMGNGLASEAWFLVNNGTEFVCCGVTFDYGDKSTNDYLEDFKDIIKNIKFFGNKI